MEAYSVRGNPTTGREVAKGILKGMDLREMRLAIERADRKTKDRAGRQWKMGPKVAALVCQLWFRDGQGEADDGSIHQTAFAWKHKEAALTERGLRTARRVAAEEGLLRSWQDRRLGDGQWTVFYELNLWEVARVIARSELENVDRLLETEGRRGHRERLEARKEQLTGTLKDLDVIDVGAGEEEAPASPPNLDTASETPGGLDTLSGRGDTLPAVHNTSQKTSPKERVPLGTPKKDPTGRSLRGPQKKEEKTDQKGRKLTADEAYELWHELLVADPFADHLDALAHNMAQRNKTKQVRYTRLWKKIGKRYLDLRESEDLSEEAWEYGFEAASACTASMNYVLKAARGYHSIVAPDDGQGAAAPRRGSYGPTWTQGTTMDVTEDDHAATDDRGDSGAASSADVEVTGLSELRSGAPEPESPAPEPAQEDGEREEIPALDQPHKGALVRLMLAGLGGESEVSRLADAHVEDPEGVPPERVAEAAMMHLPGNAHPGAVLASVEGLLVGMRGEWP